MRALVLAITLAGCGPSLHTLADHRHYREAVCAADDGSSGDRAFVRRALERDAAPQLHVEIVRPDQIAHALGTASAVEIDDISHRARFARIRLESNVVPVDGIDADVEITDGHQQVASQIDYPLLTNITGERMPPRETYSTYLHSGTFWRGLAAVFTVGVSLPFTTFRKRTVTVEPPPSAYLQTAPLAFALRAAMLGGQGCLRVAGMSKGTGLSCTWFVAIEPADRDLRLDVTVRYGAERIQRETYLSHRDAKRCIVEQVTTIPLGRTSQLEARTAQTFGPRMRPLADFRLD